MDVRDGMNRVVVTVGPGHTLREAARRMTRADVGAAVVIDPEAGGPGILTERDLLHACGADQDLDTESVCDHLTQRLEYASADWSLERAAAEMVAAASATSSCWTARRSSGSCRCATSCAAGRATARPCQIRDMPMKTAGKPDRFRRPRSEIVAIATISELGVHMSSSTAPRVLIVANRTAARRR